MTDSPLIAIGLDGADYRVLETWMDEGKLPVMASLRNRGVYGHLKGADAFVAETPWPSFLTGVLPQKTGYWGVFSYSPDSYAVKEEVVCCYDFKEFKPFYALSGKKVAIFDLPQIQLVPGLNGIQVMGWGAHSPLSNSGSLPEELLTEIEDRYGKCPSLRADHNDWWRHDRYAAYKDRLCTSIERRGIICRDLLKKERWDLLSTVFGETHSVGHDYYFTSHSDHPLSKFQEKIGAPKTPVLDIYQKVDAAIGEILSAAPADARIVLFSSHGMRANQTDLPSLVFLPEMIHRKHFPGEGFFEDLPSSKTIPPIILEPVKKSWPDEMWRLKREKNPLKDLMKKILPFNILARFDKMLRPAEGKTFFLPYDHFGYTAVQPPIWYKHLWPKMRYFAMPTYGDGAIRINLKGREGSGIVEPEEYEKVCDEIETFLSEIRSERTGVPLMKKLIRTRKNPLDNDPKLPIPDLVVLWDCEVTDAVSHPDAGRIGPLPFNRPGGHVWLGFYMAAGPGITPGRRAGAEEAIHLTSTLLHHLGSPVPDYMDAKKILF
jgi:predicted AlkP superfamily phosphohydrolase/phosphomutase